MTMLLNVMCYVAMGYKNTVKDKVLTLSNMASSFMNVTFQHIGIVSYLKVFIIV